MSHISANELMNTVDVFFVQLFGEENYMKWQELKFQLGIKSERLFVSWILNYVTENYNPDKLSEERVGDGGNSSRSRPVFPGLISPNTEKLHTPFGINNLDDESLEREGKHNVTPTVVGGLSDASMLQEAAELERSKHKNSSNLSACKDNETTLGGNDDDNGAASDAAADGTNDNGVAEQQFGQDMQEIAGTSNSADIEEPWSSNGETDDYSFGGPYRAKCRICNKLFRHRGDMQRHHKEVHLKMRKYSCEHCGRHFTRSYILRKHLEAIHYDSQNFACDVCSKSFSTRASLVEHRRQFHYIIDIT